MAELRFTIRADLKKLTSDIQGLLKKKFKIGVDGGDGVGGLGVEGKASKKQTTLLSGILGKVAGIAALLLAVQPVLDAIKIFISFILIAAIKQIQFVKNLIDKVVEIAPKVWGFMKQLPSDIWGFLKMGFDFLKDKLSVLKDSFVQKIIDLKNRVVEFFKSLPGIVKGFFINLGSKIIDLKDRLVDKLVELKVRLVQNIVDLKDKFIEKIVDLKDKFKEKVDELKDKFKDKIDELKERLALLLEGLPAKIWTLLKGLGQLIADKLKDVLPKFLGGGVSVTDAIIKPDGTIIRTDPRDTIIATQNPGAIGGGHTFIFHGVTEQRMINEVKRQLGSDQIRASRL